MKRVYAKEELCLNCRLCEVYCKTAHSHSKDIVTAYKKEEPAPSARLRVSGDNHLSVAINCRHCENPKCVEACITGAMTKDKATGIVYVNESKCIGCMSCLAVCPFGCIQTGSFAVKCDLCRETGEPACVKNCPNRALVYTALGGEQE
ncbi:MAG: 4Fe-4S dicluster domain-containing protein [Clostridia bacterium]|nr:4Fe-4S dicluster domain-containing protein [Clostridia bacterium]